MQAEGISWHEAGREVHDMSSYEVGQYGEAASELAEVSGLSSYNLKLIHETEELWREDGSEDTQEDFGIVSQDSTRQDITVIPTILTGAIRKGGGRSGMPATTGTVTDD